MLLRDRIRTPEGKSRYVRHLFATIADRYDLITVVLSYGQDRRWKERLVQHASPVAGARALDLATGTGDIAFALAGRGAHVVGLDITPRMIELARAKPQRARGPRAAGASASAEASASVKASASATASADRRSLGGGWSASLAGARVDRQRAEARGVQPSDTRFLVGDMIALPFPNHVFDIVTTAYGLRNVPNLAAAIDEIHRVLRPGGQLLSLDFNRPSNAFIRGAYLTYLTGVGATLGWVLHRDPDTYRYIPASIRQYPGAEAVVRMLDDRGFSRARYYRVLGGLMAIHHAIRN
jgi:demethylmenaquinone methyltransferase/2-methoxy-6-polyprenyl-1,4-benzoquinol methylase